MFDGFEDGNACLCVICAILIVMQFDPYHNDHLSRNKIQLFPRSRRGHQCVEPISFFIDSFDSSSLSL